MKSFYSDYARDRHVSSENPHEVDLNSAKVILNQMREPGSFLGVLPDAANVVQFFKHSDGTFSVELLDKKSREILEARINLPIAERALEAAFSNLNVKEALTEFFLQWKKIALK